MDAVVYNKLNQMEAVLGADGRRYLPRFEELPDIKEVETFANQTENVHLFSTDDYIYTKSKISTNNFEIRKWDKKSMLTETLVVINSYKYVTPWYMSDNTIVLIGEALNANKAYVIYMSAEDLEVINEVEVNNAGNSFVGKTVKKFYENDSDEYYNMEMSSNTLFLRLNRESGEILSTVSQNGTVIVNEEFEVFIISAYSAILSFDFTENRVMLYQSRFVDIDEHYVYLKEGSSYYKYNRATGQEVARLFSFYSDSFITDRDYIYVSARLSPSGPPGAFSKIKKASFTKELNKNINDREVFISQNDVYLFTTESVYRKTDFALISTFPTPLGQTILEDADNKLVCAGAILAKLNKSNLELDIIIPRVNAYGFEDDSYYYLGYNDIYGQVRFVKVDKSSVAIVEEINGSSLLMNTTTYYIGKLDNMNYIASNNRLYRFYLGEISSMERMENISTDPFSAGANTAILSRGNGYVSFGVPSSASANSIIVGIKSFTGRALKSSSIYIGENESLVISSVKLTIVETKSLYNLAQYEEV